MEFLIRVAVLGLAAVTFLANIDNFPLRNWDEAWYAEIIKNMATGQYGHLVSFWNGQYHFDKPPLYFWLSLPFFKIFGPGEWQARIVSATAAILATFFVYLISRRIFNQRIAILSVVIFLTLGQVVIRFAHGNLDALAVCLILATVYFYITSSKLLLPLSAILLALTYIAKGWILGLVPILALFLFEYFLLSRNFKKVLLVVFISVLLVSPYYVLGYRTFGQEFVRWYLFNPTASLFSLRAFSWQFFFNLARDVGFWFVPLVLSLAIGSKIIMEDKLKLYVLSLISFIFLLGISFLWGKLGWYALPVYPLVSIIIAYFIEKLFVKKFIFGGILLVIAAALQIYNVNAIENIYPDRSKVGANLGIAADKIVPKNELLILDDRDVSAFLYYSNHRSVFVLSGSDSETWEWWIFKYDDLPSLLASNKRVWVVSKDQTLVPNAQVEAEVEGYKFLKVYRP